MATKQRFSKEELREHRNAYAREYYQLNKEKIKRVNYECRARLRHLWPSHTDKLLVRGYDAASRARTKSDPVRRERRKKQQLRASRKRISEFRKLITGHWRGWLASDIAKLHTLARVRLRQEVVIAYGGKCSCCGEDNLGFLTIDHINEDGSERRKLRSEERGSPFYRMIKERGYPEDLQLLCWNCNIAKHIYGQCPHQLVSATLIGVAA